MRNLRSIFNTLWALALVASVAFLVSCGDDDEPKDFTVVELMAGDADLNGASSPTDVGSDAAITVTFSTEVDAATATDDNITLMRDYDDTEMPIMVSASGSTITITPEEVLGSGTLYILTIQTAVSSTDGQSLGAEIERNFTTAGSFAPAGVMAHFTFEGNAEDVADGYDPAAEDVVDITYVDSRSEEAGTAASFNGSSSIIEVPNADEFMSNDDFAISFWVKADGTQNGHFVLGLAGWYGFQFEIAEDWTWVKLATQYQLENGTTESEDNWFPGNGETKDNGGWQGWTFQKDVSSTGGVGETYFKDKWANVVCTYDAETKLATMYINGEMVKQHDFNLWPDDAAKKNVTGVAYAGNEAPGNKLALGFIQGSENRFIQDGWADPSNPDNKQFKGLLDDVRVFDHAITAQEVQLMYNSEKP